MAKYLDPLPPGFNPGPLDMDKPLDNQVALLKLQADLSGEPVIGIFPGKAWLWIPALALAIAQVPRGASLDDKFLY